MALLTGQEYLESLKEFSPEIYIWGEKVQEVWTHPLLRQTVNHIAAGYDFSLDDRYRSQSSVFSPSSAKRYQDSSFTSRKASTMWWLKPD